MADKEASENGVSFTPPVPEKKEYEVGYGKPPKDHQIKPGEVRNPRGKRKGTRSVRSEVLDVLNMPVALREGGGKVRTSKASLLKIRELMLRGNLKAAERLLELAAQHNVDEDPAGSTAALLAEDELILAHARERTRIAAEANASPPAVLPAPGPEDLS